MPPGKERTSPVWNFFVQDGVEKAQCVLCQKPPLSTAGRNTSNIWNHLRSDHPDEYAEADAQRKKAKGDAEKQKASSSAPAQQVKRQITMAEAMEKNKKWEQADPKTLKIDYSIGEMIATDDMPFNVVEGIGFRRHMAVAQPSYNLKHRDFYNYLVCEKIYPNLKNSVKVRLEKVGKLSFSTDIWSQPSAGVSLLSLTAHGIDQETFERVNLVLAASELEGAHTGEAVAEKFEEMLAEWNIDRDRVHIVMRDQGSNMIRATLLAGLGNKSCTIHQIQNVVKAGLLEQKAVSDLIKKCRAITSHFNHSVKAQDELKGLERRTGLDHLMPIQDVETRWNSTYYMFERAVKIKDALTLYATETEKIPAISAYEWLLIEKVVKILRAFEEVTRRLSGGDASISEVIPLVMVLQKLCQERDDGADSGVKSMRSKLLDELRRRFSGLTVIIEDDPDSFVFALATFLDPRYKLKFFPGCAQQLKQEINRLCRVGATSAPDTDFDDPAVKRRKTQQTDYVKGLPSACLESSSEDETIEQVSDSAIDQEFNRYTTEKRISEDNSPLVWWKANMHNYPNLANVAQTYLACPPSSVDSERLFSGAGLIYTPLRTKLHGSRAERLLFIKYNLPLVNFAYEKD